MSDFAKLFRVEDQQVLFLREYNDEHDADCILATFDQENGILSGRVTLTFRFENEEMADQCFNAIDEAVASRVLETGVLKRKDNDAEATTD